MINNVRALTLTILAKMTSNYGEGLGNVSSVQKVYRDGNIYAIRTKESLKEAIMDQSGMYDDLKVTIDRAAQKEVTPELNASNCRALEGGYMNTKVKIKGNEMTYVRKSSFYLTDAVACEPFVNEPRFHNNLYIASRYARDKGLNVQNASDTVGLMPYNYEYDKGLKVYSITFDLEMIGKDENFNCEASKDEKAKRVNLILETIEKLDLGVNKEYDNAEPIFVVGGLSDRKTHVFENVVKVKRGRLSITKGLLDKIALGYKTALLEGDNFVNEQDIIDKLKPLSVSEFFEELRQGVNKYYGV